MKKIKYHQNGVSPEYGADGSLTDNWNPDYDYGNEYIRVHFRIGTPSFDCGFFSTTEDRERWLAEASSLIESFGIAEDSNYHGKKQTYLYAHPQDISGVVRKNDVKRIAEAINNMELSYCRWVDLYETVYDMTDEDYREYLDGRHDDIRKKLFDECHTTRTNKYYNSYDVAIHVAKLFKLHRLGLADGDNYRGGQTVDYVLAVIDEMVESGYMKCFVNDNGKYVRSLNKTEQKKLKLFV